ncbi:IS30 family transposase [Nonomuraea rubra]|uniref:IS30 family transposase n=1 Tax=Nonomuraea rubra TaxID=46180 RepID=UPI0033FC2492
MVPGADRGRPAADARRQPAHADQPRKHLPRDLHDLWKLIPRELCTKLRTHRPIRKNKRNTVKGQWRSQITGARPIEERPDTANARTELGHLEGDLIVGARNSQIATLVDRKSRYLTMVALPSRHTTTVIPALQQAFSRMDARLRSTLTWDRGMELAGHRLLTEATGVDVYFAAPRSPWQRGTNENTAPASASATEPRPNVLP